MTNEQIAELIQQFVCPGCGLPSADHVDGECPDEDDAGREPEMEFERRTRG